MTYTSPAPMTLPPPAAADLSAADSVRRATASSQPPRVARFGAVTYLNSKPLIEGLADDLQPASLTLDYPSHLAADLAAGRLDVALVPSFSALAGLCDGSASLLSNACVAARGPVRSVQLLCRKAPGEIRTLALDDGSRTSAALARILLMQQYGVVPETQPFPLATSTRACDTDAVLMIGDRAMHPPADDDSFTHRIDLGEAWKRWTGLPFVFAVWAARSGSDAPDSGVPARWATLLETARDRGVAALDTIAEREAAGVHVSESEAAAYLRHNLHFTLGPAERQGLLLFAELAHECGLLGCVPEV